MVGVPGTLIVLGCYSTSSDSSGSNQGETS
jgi:hypothetical protein